MSKKLHCPFCWNVLTPQAQYCPHCGKALPGDLLAQQQEFEERLDLDGRKRGGGCCGVLLLVALLLAFFGLIRCFFAPLWFSLLSVWRGLPWW